MGFGSASGSGREGFSRKLKKGACPLGEGRSRPTIPFQKRDCQVFVRHLIYQDTWGQRFIPCGPDQVQYTLKPTAGAKLFCESWSFTDLSEASMFTTRRDGTELAPPGDVRHHPTTSKGSMPRAQLILHATGSSCFYKLYTSNRGKTVNGIHTSQRPPSVGRFRNAASLQQLRDFGSSTSVYEGVGDLHGVWGRGQIGSASNLWTGPPRRQVSTVRVRNRERKKRRKKKRTTPTPRKIFSSP